MDDVIVIEYSWSEAPPDRGSPMLGVFFVESFFIANLAESFGHTNLQF
ncbi:hypothetical protein LJK87_25835 [Paenibacillus sp. P25]|nr:hypothetical protein LJK87_25835 [Paenibacillus sp. P25]